MLSIRSLVVAGLGLIAGPALAIDPIPQQDGWSGFLLGGIGYTELESNEVAGHTVIDVGNETINSIDDPPRSDDEFHFMGTGEVSYTWAESRTQAFLGSSIENFVTFDFSQQLGVRREFGDVGVLQAGRVLSALPTEVYEDPFVEGEARSDTDRDSTGLRLQWDQILGSSFEAILQFRDIDIDTERSGDFLVDRGDLDPADQALLDRNGDDLQARLIYKWRPAPNHRLDGQVRYTSRDRDGDAISSDRLSFQGSWVFVDGPVILALNGVVGKEDYDAANPIYGRKADKDVLGLNGTFNYRLPWKSGRWSSTTIVTWAEDDSDIDFYDTEVLSVITGLTYRFGNLPPRLQPPAGRRR